MDGGGNRGGTSWTKRGFKRVYDFRVEPSHSVSQWTRAHCDNRPHCVRFRLGSKPERHSVQKIAPKQRCVHLKDIHCQEKDRTRAKERARRWEQWCWLKFWYYEQGARIVGNPFDASLIVVIVHNQIRVCSADSSRALQSFPNAAFLLFPWAVSTSTTMNYQSSVPVSVSVSGISQQSQSAMPTPGTVPAPVPVPPPQFGSGSSGSSGAGQFGSGTVSGPATQSGTAGSQFALSNSAAIRGEIHRFESVHPNIYAIYDLVERIDDLALQNQIREHVISIEGKRKASLNDATMKHCFVCQCKDESRWCMKTRRHKSVYISNHPN